MQSYFVSGIIYGITGFIRAGAGSIAHFGRLGYRFFDGEDASYNTEQINRFIYTSITTVDP
jgi:hypothetical protein